MWYAAIIGALLQVVGSFIGKALISLGIGVVAYKGVDVSIAFAKDHALAALNGFPAEALNVMGVLQIDTALNMLFSALLMRLTFKGLTAGVMKSFKLNP